MFVRALYPKLKLFCNLKCVCVYIHALQSQPGLKYSPFQQPELLQTNLYVTNFLQTFLID